MESTRKTNNNLGAIFGNGRSGTTWLGSIISSHPDISYRFEPFHRLQKTNVDIRKAMELIRSETFSSQDLPQIYNVLAPAYPELEKPPFFSKNFSLRSGRKFAWPLSKNNSFGSYIFQNIYTPKERPMLIFKEVAFVDIFSQLLTKGNIPIIYLVRHPCAVVSSVMKGQKSSLMPSKRRSVLESLLLKHQPLLAEKFNNKLDSLDICEQEALLWLIDVDRSIKICQNNSNALIVIYEQLTREPLEISKKVFQHLNLKMNPQSVDFIKESTQNVPVSKIKSGEVGVNSYFSVFRDPNISRDSWKTKMSQQEQTKIMKIVENNESFKLCADLGFWR